MNIIGYWFPDRLALKASRAQPVEPGTMPELEAMVQDLAQRAQVPTPRLYTIPSKQPNAFATGRNPQHAAVAVTEGLLDDLPPGQVSSIACGGGRGDRGDREHLPVLAALRRRERGRRTARLDRTARDDHRRAAGGVATPARRLALARVPRRRDRSAVPRPRSAARRRPRDARARLASPPGDGQSGERVALRRQPIGPTGGGDFLRDASADRRARTPTAGARR